MPKDIKKWVDRTRSVQHPVPAISVKWGNRLKSICLVIGVALGLAAPTAAQAAIDGKVQGLNQAAFDALAAVKKRNPGSLTERDAKELEAGVMADGKVDLTEQDLLIEMTQSVFRNITVRPVGSSQPSDPQVMTFPTVGNAKRVLQNVLNPQLDLDGAWAEGTSGWKDVIAESRKSPQQETRVINYVSGKLSEQWVLSNMGNGYKPLRDLIGKLYGYSNSAGADTEAGRKIVYRSMEQLDRNTTDSVPDFFYNWLNPATPVKAPAAPGPGS